MAMAVTTFEGGARRAPVFWLLATALLGVAFIAIKSFEYWLEYQEHLVPALNFDLARHGGVAEIFFMFYFCATGLHALHLLIGISMVSWLAWWIGSGRHRPRRINHPPDRPLLALRGHRLDLPLPAYLPRREERMSAATVLRCWLALMVLLALTTGLAFVAARRGAPCSCR